MQEQIVMQKIYDGDTGSIAATKIYNNDSKLLNAIKDIKDELAAYGSLITINVEVTEGGAPVTITLVQGKGYDETSVMSQKAVTEFVEGEVVDNCKIGATIPGTIDMPDNTDYVNLWVSRASSNAQGQSLTELYNDVQDLKNVFSAIQESINRLQEQVDNMQTTLTDTETKTNYVKVNAAYIGEEIS